MSISILCIVKTACECEPQRPFTWYALYKSSVCRCDEKAWARRQVSGAARTYFTYLVVAGCALTSSQLLTPIITSLTPLYKCTFRLQRVLRASREGLSIRVDESTYYSAVDSRLSALRLIRSRQISPDYAIRNRSTQASVNNSSLIIKTTFIGKCCFACKPPTRSRVRIFS